MRHFIEINGVRYELIRHRARGAKGYAWSAYRDDEEHPYKMYQTRTREEMEDLLFE